MSIGYVSGFYRGGSWNFDPQYARVANRYCNILGYRYLYLGVRLVRRCTGALIMCRGPTAPFGV